MATLAGNMAAISGGVRDTGPPSENELIMSCLDTSRCGAYSETLLLALLYIGAKLAGKIAEVVGEAVEITSHVVDLLGEGVELRTFKF